MSSQRLMNSTAMPQGWRSPFLNNDGTRKVLYQVVVQPTTGGEPYFVGPAMEQNVADEFCSAIKQQIALGNERDWSNPTVLPVSSV